MQFDHDDSAAVVSIAIPAKFKNPALVNSPPLSTRNLSGVPCTVICTLASITEFRFLFLIAVAQENRVKMSI